MTIKSNAKPVVYVTAKPRLSVNGHLIRAIMNFKPGNKDKAKK